MPQREEVTRDIFTRTWIKAIRQQDAANEDHGWQKDMVDKWRVWIELMPVDD